MGTARSTRRGQIAASVLAATALVVTGCAGGSTPESTATKPRFDNVVDDDLAPCEDVSAGCRAAATNVSPTSTKTCAQ